MSTADGRHHHHDHHRRRRADAERSVASILDAAVECLAVSPEASMTDIARSAGVGRVTLYGHFSSREELRDAAVEHIVDQVQRAFDAIALDDLPADQALEEMLRTSWRVIDRHRAFFTAVMHSTHHDAMRHHRVIFDRIAAVVDRGRADGLFRTDLDTHWLVAVCVGLVHAAVLYTDTTHAPTEDAVAALIATVRAAYRPTHEEES